MASFNETMGAEIRRIRKDKGLSQQQLADSMREHGQDHWRQNTVSRVEAGRQSLDIAELEALQQCLGTEALLQLIRVTASATYSKVDRKLDLQLNADNQVSVVLKLIEEAHVTLDNYAKDLHSEVNTMTEDMHGLLREMAGVLRYVASLWDFTEEDEADQDDRGE